MREKRGRQSSSCAALYNRVRKKKKPISTKLAESRQKGERGSLEKKQTEYY